MRTPSHQHHFSRFRPRSFITVPAPPGDIKFPASIQSFRSLGDFGVSVSLGSILLQRTRQSLIRDLNSTLFYSPKPCSAFCYGFYKAYLVSFVIFFFFFGFLQKGTFEVWNWPWTTTVHWLQRPKWYFGKQPLCAPWRWPRTRLKTRL